MQTKSRVRIRAAKRSALFIVPQTGNLIEWPPFHFSLFFQVCLLICTSVDPNMLFLTCSTRDFSGTCRLGMSKCFMAAAHKYWPHFFLSHPSPVCHSKFMQRLGLVADGEPFRQLLTQGMVLGRTHKSSVDQRYLKPADITKQTAGAGAETAGHTNLMAIEVATGKPTLEAWEKMSKSKYNGVLPEDIVKQYGIDTMRTFILFKVSVS